MVQKVKKAITKNKQRSLGMGGSAGGGVIGLELGTICLPIIIAILQSLLGSQGYTIPEDLIPNVERLIMWCFVVLPALVFGTAGSRTGQFLDKAERAISEVERLKNGQETTDEFVSSVKK
jgi:hypothetical protein